MISFKKQLSILALLLIIGGVALIDTTLFINKPSSSPFSASVFDAVKGFLFGEKTPPPPPTIPLSSAPSTQKCFAVMEVAEKKEGEQVKYSVENERNECGDLDHLLFREQYDPNMPIQIVVKDNEKILGRYSFVSGRITIVDPASGADLTNFENIIESNEGSFLLILPTFDSVTSVEISDGTSISTLSINKEILKGKGAGSIGITGGTSKDSWFLGGDYTVTWNASNSSRDGFSIFLLRNGKIVDTLATNISGNSYSGVLSGNFEKGDGYAIRVVNNIPPELYVDSVTFSLRSSSEILKVEDIAISSITDGGRKAVAQVKISNPTNAPVTNLLLKVTDSVSNVYSAQFKGYQVGSPGRITLNVAPRASQVIIIPLSYDVIKKINVGETRTFYVYQDTPPLPKDTSAAWIDDHAMYKKSITLAGTGTGEIPEISTVSPLEINISDDLISILGTGFVGEVTVVFKKSGSEQVVEVPSASTANGWAVNVYNAQIPPYSQSLTPGTYEVQVKNKTGGVSNWFGPVVIGDDLIKFTLKRTTVEPGSLLVLNGSNLPSVANTKVILKKDAVVKEVSGSDSVSTASESLIVRLPSNLDFGKYSIQLANARSGKTSNIETFTITKVEPEKIVEKPPEIPPRIIRHSIIGNDIFFRGDHLSTSTPYTLKVSGPQNISLIASVKIDPGELPGLQDMTLQYTLPCSLPDGIYTFTIQKGGLSNSGVLYEIKRQAIALTKKCDPILTPSVFPSPSSFASPSPASITNSTPVISSISPTTPVVAGSASVQVVGSNFSTLSNNTVTLRNILTGQSFRIYNQPTTLGGTVLTFIPLSTMPTGTYTVMITNGTTERTSNIYSNLSVSNPNTSSSSSSSGSSGSSSSSSPSPSYLPSSSPSASPSSSPSAFVPSESELNLAAIWKIIKFIFLP